MGPASRSVSGAIHTGVCSDAASGGGIFAELGAVAALIMAGESRGLSEVAVHHEGAILLPGGRCRELLVQIADGNATAPKRQDAAQPAVGSLSARPPPTGPFTMTNDFHDRLLRAFSCDFAAATARAVIVA